MTPEELLRRIFADPKPQARLLIEVNLDPVPGWGDNPEDFRVLVQRLLDDAVGHYHPVVTIAPDEEPPA